jgi:hypothetical protein
MSVDAGIALLATSARCCSGRARLTIGLMKKQGMTWLRLAGVILAVTAAALVIW